VDRGPSLPEELACDGCFEASLLAAGRKGVAEGLRGRVRSWTPLLCCRRRGPVDNSASLRLVWLSGWRGAVADSEPAKVGTLLGY